MQVQLARIFARAVIVLAVVGLAGAALGATKTSSTTKADCYSQAALHFSIANAQCAGYPAGSEASNYCLAMAAQNYASAIQTCATSTAAIGSDVTSPRPTRLRAGLVGKSG